MHLASIVSLLPKASANMNSYYNGVPHSSSVSEISTAPPSPVSCSTTNPSATSPASSSRHGGVIIPNRVFVGGIASNTTETELQELFSQFGNIQEIKIISDRGGACKGYGFVTFETEEEAKKVQHQPDSIVLKERRLNIAPAVMKQQPFARAYDIAPSSLLYHNGTTYTYQNGMAFFTAQTTQTPYASREAALYSAPFGANQTTPNQPYPQIMYAPYTPPVQYLAAGQQYQYPMPNSSEGHIPLQQAPPPIPSEYPSLLLPPPHQFMPYMLVDGVFDYFKATSQYIYAPPGALNGALNNALNGLGSSSQSPSPGYGPPSAPGPHGADLYYSNGINHPTSVPLPHQPMYSIEPTPAHSEDWNPEPRQAPTPVVSLRKLHQEGSVEEMEITRTPPKKSFPPGGPRPRSRRPGRSAPAPSQGSGRGPGRSSLGAILSGQRSASSPHLPSTPNSCLHRSTSLSPSNQVTPAYSSNRQAHSHPHQHPRQSYVPRGGGGGGRSNMRNSGPRTHMGSARGPPHNSHHNESNRSSTPNQILGSVPSNGQTSSSKSTTAPKTSGESVNGIKNSSSAGTSPSPNISQKQEKVPDQGGAGDGATICHALPLSPPNTPVPVETGASITTGGSDGDVCQKMKALAL
ncbi:Protein boule-like [Frankliniella fusca]|uniref:Protein boule-like n=1 Tax=Frankliniella fusca TaxID=407009 RepID=A0AAE1L6X8_9NEOP|nr:Protein boule-like [Frankliniella fusca]